MKKNKYIGILMLAATMLTAASCSDFDDYNKEVADATVAGNQTLWENIRQNQQLSNFASLLEKTGYADKLNTSHFYTVWAPQDGSYDFAAIQALSDKAQLSQFVENHIANYNYSASGQFDTRVKMLNEKSYQFTGTQGNYSFDGVRIDQANIGSNNGVMHIMNGMAAYYPGLYEYINSTELSGPQSIDSLRKYVQHFEETTLDIEHSVVGPIVNGMQTYVDSVMITKNALWDMLNTQMQNEDSSYTFLIPTNDAWVSQYNKVKEYYNYAPLTKAQLFTEKGVSTTNAEVKIANDEWQDSLTCRFLTNWLSYSNNDAYNRWLKTSPLSYGDTLRTTNNAKLSNPQDILSQTVEEVPLSNGMARIIGDYGMYPWETYAPERKVSVANERNRAFINNGTGTRVNVIDVDKSKVTLENGETTLNYYLVHNDNEYLKPELTVYLRNVLSTTYNIYCVFVPENVDILKKDVETKPNRVIFTLNYCERNGSLKNKIFLNMVPDDEIDQAIADFKTKYKFTSTITKAETNTNYQSVFSFVNDTSKVDTLLVGEFTFPVCYQGLGDEYCPNIKISTPYSVFNESLRNSFARDLRIAAIILKPKDLVEFEQSNK